MTEPSDVDKKISLPTNAYDCYYRDVSKHPPLSPQSERNLLIKYKAIKCPHARKRLTEANLRFVIKMAKKFSRNNSELMMDLASAGNIGLLQALERYDPKHNTRFLTYATSWILLHIRNELKSNELVAMPTWRKKAIRHINRLRENIASRDGREASNEELGTACGIAPDRLQQLSTSHRFDYESEFACNNPNNAAVGAELDAGLQPEQAAVKQEQRVVIEQLINTLSTKERPIICNYFGFLVPPTSADDGEQQILETTPWSMKKIGRHLHVSSERVRQIKLFAIKKMRRKLHRLGIETGTELTEND